VCEIVEREALEIGPLGLRSLGDGSKLSWVVGPASTLRVGKRHWESDSSRGAL
jgi:hypothetical protein